MAQQSSRVASFKHTKKKNSSSSDEDPIKEYLNKKMSLQAL